MCALSSLATGALAAAGQLCAAARCRCCVRLGVTSSEALVPSSFLLLLVRHLLLVAMHLLLVAGAWGRVSLQGAAAVWAAAGCRCCVRLL